jgi:uncharacterized protein (TIGR02996 family)
MTDEQALLKAIADQPDEDTPRLAFADWLDESGTESNVARAEFIRIQVELATPTDPEREKELRRREAELWQPHRHTWKAAIPDVPGINWRGYDRGFLTAIDAEQMDTFVKHAEELFSAAPVQSVRILHARPNVTPKLVALEKLDWLRELDLTGCEVLTDGDPEYLADAQGMRNLRVLRVGGNRIGVPGIRALISSRSRFLRNLRQLGLGLNPQLAEDRPILAEARAAFPDAKVL